MQIYLQRKRACFNCIHDEQKQFFPFLRRVEMVLLGTFQTVRKIKKLARLGSPPDLILKKKKSNAENE